MQAFSVLTSNEAASDLFEIVDYLNNFSPAIGEKYFDEIDEKINSLETMPDRCSLVSYKPLRRKGYRWIFVRNYTIFFTINSIENTVVIRRVLYARRNYTALL